MSHYQSLAPANIQDNRYLKRCMVSHCQSWAPANKQDKDCIKDCIMIEPLPILEPCQLYKISSNEALLCGEPQFNPFNPEFTILIFIHYKPRIPSKQKTFVQHLYNVGTTSKTLGRRCTNAIQMFCVYWAAIAILDL